MPAACVSYLIGGIPVGVLIGRSQGVDIRREGSGNIGATNVLRVLGVKFGLLAFALDVLKGALPVLAGRAVGLPVWPLCASAVAAVIGHCYSPYLKLGGGKAVAAGLGVLLAFNWAAGLICFAIWIILTAATRYVSLASIVAYCAAPGVAWALGSPAPLIVTFGVLALLSIYRHRDNIRRLLAGTESKIGRRRSAAGTQPDASADDASEGGDQP